jgi:hypothetical protein
MSEKPKKLTGAQYWEWRTTISEMNEAQAKYEAARNQAQFLVASSEIATLKAAVFKLSNLRTSTDNAEAAKAEYSRFKSELEKKVKTSLSGKVIDDVTFEIRELEPDPKT